MANRTVWPGRTALYRFFNAAGILLYVGVATYPHTRWKQHAREKSWWPEVAEKAIEWHPTRVEAEQAEGVAINTEEPLYNDVIPLHGRTEAPPVAITIRIPTELYEDLRLRAFNERTSMNALIVKDAGDWLEARAA
jgi:GIY-YIG catalytic domain